MATNNRNTGSGNENFKQIESDSWSNIYLPAICAGVIMALALFLGIACSKKSDNTISRISAPTQSAVNNSSAPATTAAITPESPKKTKIRKHRPTSATYVSGTYGVSFTYPRKYSLAAGSEKASMPVQPNFLKPGAVEVAAVDMPDDTYPNTDFSSALLNVTVNSNMTSDECAQFVPASNDPAAAKPTTIKLGSNEFTELEQMSGETTHESDLKYFHLFKNGACYEFALDVETSRKADEDLAQVDRGQVFKQLEKVLTTARIKEVQLPGVEKTETATTSSSPELNAIEGKSADGTSAESKPSADVKSSDSATETKSSVTPGDVKPADSMLDDSKASGVQPASATTDEVSKSQTALIPASDSGTQKAQAVTPEQK